MNKTSNFNRLFPVTTLAIMLLVTVPILFAEGPPKRCPHSPKMGKSHFKYGNKIPFEIIIEKLEPTEEQIEKIYALEDEMRAATRSQKKQMREIKKKLKTELALDEPIAAEVGQLVISRKHLSQKVKKTRRSFRESLATILTPEQLKKLRTYRWKVAAGRKSPKFHTENHNQKPDGKNRRPEWAPPNSSREMKKHIE